MLQYVFGRSGSGKTEYVFNSIARNVADGEDNIFLITPEQYSFVAERRLLTMLGERNVGRVRSISFSRLASIIANQYGMPDLPILSKGAKAVLVKRVLDKVKDELVLFGNKTDDPSFVQSIISIYDEMKSCRVSYDDIVRASDSCNKELLSKKLKDIALIISTYDGMIGGRYLDPAAELTRIYEQLCDIDFFTDSIVYIDGFSGFVAQEYKIIEVILRQAREVHITFCTDSYESGDKYDLFSYVNSNVSILTTVAEKSGTVISKPILLTSNHRTADEALLAVERSFYNNVKHSLSGASDSVSLFAAGNICDECDYVAAQINRLLRSGYHADDIAVICRDLGKYESELKFSFDKYDIPYYNDERQSINNESLIMFVCFLLRCVIYSYQSEDIFSLLKTGLTSLPNEDINNLENYAYTWSIKGSGWKREFTDSPRGFAESLSDSDITQLAAINATREYVISRISKFASRCRNRTAEDISKAMYYALIDFGVDDGVKRLAIALDSQGRSALAAEQGRVWDLLMMILDRMATVTDEESINLREYYKLFSLMLSCEDLGVLPAGLDNVQIGSADRIRCDNPRAVFVVGANEGEFPMAISSSGLLTESDRSDLINNNFKLYSYGEALNAQEKYFAYMAVSAAGERLYVSYITGGDKAESSIVTELRQILPDALTAHSSDVVTIDDVLSADSSFAMLTSHYDEDSDIINSLKAYFTANGEYNARLSAVEGIVKNAGNKLTDKTVAAELFKKNMYLSASRVEDYYKCAFLYYCKFGLKARPRVRAELDPMQTGTIIHYVLEQIVKNNDDITTLTDIHIRAEVDRYLNYYLDELMGDAQNFTARFRYQMLRLSKLLVAVVLRLRDEFAQSDFRARAFELKIGNGSDNEPVKSGVVDLDDGGTISIRGSIDRVDTYDENGVRYVRVVDYKSGTKKYQLSDIMYGLNLQMLIYLFTLCKSDSEYAGIPSGVLYMHSAREVYNLTRNSKSEDIQKKETSEFKMQGIVLNDEEHRMAEHMEHDLKGKYIPVSDKKSGITGDIVTMSEIGILSRKIDSLLASMGNSLLAGNIDQNPVNGTNHDRTCDYCDYRGVCMNRTEVTPRDIEPMTNDEVFAKLKEEFHYE